ncbi:hypothetical protein [Aquiflexum sp.]|uniref:hypothetical protein n=1 Tax=Aquiflexum sp. TaxID=1872584 RepID=UPI0035948B16
MKHAESIYLNKKNNGLLNPFSFQIDPMKRLLLVNFENNPDAIYKGFEPQYFDDPIHGKGLLVIGWRNDLKVDVYHEDGLKLNPDTYDITGKGLNLMLVREFGSAVFEVLEAGVRADISFEDIDKRKIEIRIFEQHPKKRQPFGLLAPMGDAAESPSAMPLVYVHDFYFVRRKHTGFQLTIDGKQHKPDTFPIPLDGTWMYFTRYSADPFIVTFNSAVDGKLETMDITGNQMIGWENTQLEISENGPALEIKMMTKMTSDHEINILFEPAFPQINLLKDNVELSGNFSVKGHSSTGMIGGNYNVKKHGNKIRILLEPSEGWIPNEPKLTVWFLYKVVKTFKHWPKTYRWTAELEEVDGSWEMKSKWERIK